MASCAVVASFIGCQSSGLAKLNPLGTDSLNAEKETKVGTPDRVVATWTETVLHESGKGGTRGFGGRLFFYERQSDKPIRVTGQLVVYAFEEDGRGPTDHCPTKRYVFPAEQFAKHETESEAGMSYSLWLPWDQVGGEQSEVSLIARFEPLQGGGLVVSDQTRHRLPGQARPNDAVAIATTNPDGAVRQASNPGNATLDDTNQFATQVGFQEQNASDANPRASTRMSTTTISLPSRFAPSTPTRGRGVPIQSMQQSVSAVAADVDPTRTKTTVSYLTPGESVRQSIRSRSFGSSPTVQKDRSLPASPLPFDQTR
ncbi:MAG: hypothetical protein ACR2NU_17375 [Aeoliella sp.]